MCMHIIIQIKISTLQAFATMEKTKNALNQIISFLAWKFHTSSFKNVTLRNTKQSKNPSIHICLKPCSEDQYSSKMEETCKCLTIEIGQIVENLFKISVQINLS